MNIEGGKEKAKNHVRMGISPKSIRGRNKPNSPHSGWSQRKLPYAHTICTHIRTHNEEKHPENDAPMWERKARALRCSLEVNDSHSVCVFFFSSFGFSMLPIYLLPRNIMSHYARVLCIRISSHVFVFNWDTRALMRCCVGGEMWNA